MIIIIFQVLEYVEKGSRLLAPEACPEWCYEVMLKCWNYEPTKRPRFGDLAKLFAEQVALHGVEHVVIV